MVEHGSQSPSPLPPMTSSSARSALLFSIGLSIVVPASGIAQELCITGIRHERWSVQVDGLGNTWSHATVRWVADDLANITGHTWQGAYLTVRDYRTSAEFLVDYMPRWSDGDTAFSPTGEFVVSGCTWVLLGIYNVRYQQFPTVPPVVEHSFVTP